MADYEFRPIGPEATAIDGLFNDFENFDPNKDYTVSELLGFITSKAALSSIFLSIQQLIEKTYEANANAGYTNLDVELAKGAFSTLAERLDDILYQASHSTINLDRAGQDLKEALTGGAVAVVGTDAVDTINIKDNALRLIKMLASDVNLINPANYNLIMSKDGAKLNIYSQLYDGIGNFYTGTGTTVSFSDNNSFVDVAKMLTISIKVDGGGSVGPQINATVTNQTHAYVQGYWINKSDILNLDAKTTMRGRFVTDVSSYYGANMTKFDMLKVGFTSERKEATYTVVSTVMAEFGGYMFIQHRLMVHTDTIKTINARIDYLNKVVPASLRVVGWVFIQSPYSLMPHHLYLGQSLDSDSEGGANLLLNGAFYNGVENWNLIGTASVDSAMVYTTKPVLRLPDYEAKAIQEVAIGSGVTNVSLSIKGNRLVTVLIEWLDSAKVVVDSKQNQVELTSGNRNTLTFEKPTNATKIRVTLYGSTNSPYVENVQLETGTTAHDFNINEKDVVFQKQLNDTILNAGLESPLKGAKGNLIGDSIAAPIDGYAMVIQQALDTQVIDRHAIGGRPIANGTANGDGANTYGKVFNGTTVDYLQYVFTIIAGLTNDFKLNAPLGVIKPIGSTFDTNTSIGALQDLIEYILQANPSIQIFMSTPLHRNNDGYSSETTNTAGHKLVDYVDAMIKVGELYSIPVYDAYRKSGVNMLNLDKYTYDGLHLNGTGSNTGPGYSMVGGKLAKFIVENYVKV